MNHLKFKQLAFATLLVLTFNVQNAQAQFFKKLVKAAGEVLDAASSISDSSNSSSKKSSSSSKKGKSKTSQAYNSVDVSLIDAVRFGNSVRVGFVVKNTCSDPYEVVLNGASFVCGGHSYDLSAAYWGCYGLMYSSLTYGSEYLPSNAQIKGYMFVKDIPDEVTTIDKVNFYANFNASSGDGYSFDIDNGSECKTLSGIAIDPYKAGTPEGSYSTYPDLMPDVISFQRSGTTVSLTFSLSNTNKVSRISFDDWVAYDENGTSYEAPMGPLFKCNGEEVWGSNSVKFTQNSSAIFTMQIRNVPASVSNFSMIRIPLQDVSLDNSIGNSSIFNNMIVFRNLKITEAPKTTTVKRTTTPANRTTSTRTVRRTTTRR